jgi:hypothetical protein
MERQSGKKMGRKQFLAGLAATLAALLTGGVLRNRWAHDDVTAVAAASALTGTNGQAVANLHDFGADPTGTKDSTEAFLRALAWVESSAAANPAASAVGDTNRRGRAKLYIPEGSYYIAKPEALMRRSYKSRTVGLHIQGAGRGLTQIIYGNAAPDRYLLYNNDAWMFLTIADIEFVSTNPVNNFMYSYSEGGAQNCTFERCLWNGTWNEIFRLEGTNTNSEMTWYHCGIAGRVNKAVYVPGTGGSDQFLNYNFFACQFEVSEGDYLVFEKGGNINVWGGSLIHRDKSRGGTFFKLLNGSHSGGVQRFLCIGARFEHRNADSKLIECEWNDGTVSFINCDMSSQAFRLQPAVNAIFRSKNQKMPSIKFQECALMGRHAYSFLNTSWRYPHNVVYENCEFAHGMNAADFIVYLNEDETNRQNIGGQPLIVFRNCRSLSGTAETAFFDSDHGFRQNNRALLTKKLISIKGATGAFPARGGAETFRLPSGAIILSVSFLCRAGAFNGSGSVEYWIETSETVPTRIATVRAASQAQGFQQRVETFFECDTEERSLLKLRAGADVKQPNPAALCLIEYVG